MHVPISRRDFLDGVAMAVTAAMLPAGAGGGESATPAAAALEAYPPRRLGERGQYPGADAVAHALRDDTFWRDAGSARDTGESRSDAIEAADMNVAGMSQEQRDAIVANQAAAVR